MSRYSHQQESTAKIKPFLNTYSGGASACVTGAVSPGDFSSWLFCLYFLIKSIRTAWCPIFFTSCWTIRPLSARRAAPLTSSSGKKKKKMSLPVCWVKHCKTQHSAQAELSLVLKDASKLVLCSYKIICVFDKNRTLVLHNSKYMFAPKKVPQPRVTIKTFYFHINASPLPILSNRQFW